MADEQPKEGKTIKGPEGKPVKLRDDGHHPEDSPNDPLVQPAEKG